MGTLAHDLRHGFRLLVKSPGFTLAAVLLLALGIGANTAIFSVVNAVLLQPLPFPEADRLVGVWHTPPQSGFPGFKKFSVSPANFFDWQAQSTVFERMSIIHFGSLNLTGGNEPEALTVARVSADYFAVLKAKPLLGRTFTEEEGGGDGDRVVVLSDSLWRDRFSSDRTIVGKSIPLDGEPYRVVGVTAPGTGLSDDVKIWVPKTWTPKERAVRANHNAIVIARLKPGVDFARAQAEMDVISRRLEKQYPEDDAGWGALVEPLREDIVGDVKPLLLVLLGAVALVLLIACANVANLLLARTLGRRKEIAVRTALGASRGRLLRQLVAETVLLSLLGGLCGLVLAKAGVDGILAFLADRLPRAPEVGMSATVFLFALGVSMVAGLLAGIAPAWRATKADIATSLKQGLGRTDSDATGNRTRTALIVCEVALSLVLLVGASLLVRSLWLLAHVDPGFDTRGVLTMSLPLPSRKYPTPESQLAFFERALERLKALPGVESVGGVDNLPLTGGGNWPIAVEGRPALPLAQQPNVSAHLVMGDYLRTLRIPLKRGRLFTDADRGDAPAVILVNESMARKFWPGEDPIGKRLTATFLPETVRTVVGVVGDTRHRGLDKLEPVPTMYLPYRQVPIDSIDIALRARSSALGGAAIAAIHELDPEQPVSRLRTLDSLVASSLAHQRFTMLLLAGFAGIAVLLAAIGITSVLSYVVRRRRREIGIRMALGAETSDVIGLVVRQGMRPTLVGIGVGLAAALALGRVLSSLVYGISVSDPLTFAAVPALLALVALAACLVPAGQAARIGAARVLGED